jgi:hypothetical protein
MRIPLLDRYAKAHPAADAPEIELVTLADALTRKFRRDQHFAAYTPSLPHRLSGDSLTTTTAAMQLTVFDVDDPGKVDGHAREEWREAERTKISRLVDLGLFAYLTRGGYRLVGRLDEPITISSTTDAAKWRATYLSWCQYLTRVHQIAADTACQDFSRLFRIPHGTRERGQEPEALPTYGDPENIGTWAPELAPEDIVEPEASRGARAVTPREGEDPGARIAPLGIRVAHALAYAESLPPAVSGQGGHNALLTAASTLYRGLYLPRDVAEQVLETYSERCEPPWKSKDLAHKLDAVEGSSEGWGELIAAILFLEAAEQVCPRPANENAATTDTIASPDVPSAPERPEVVITNSAMRETVDAAIVALAREPNVYRSGNEIVRVVRNIKAPKGINRDTDTPLIKAMPDAAIRETIEANASWIRIVEKNDTIEKRAALPPAWVVEGIVARDTWPQLRALEAVTESPILRSDGTVLDAPGFDPDTGILYVPNAAYPRVPSIPTDQEIASAVAVIRDAICDFKFQTPAHEAGFFAAVLTPFVRTQISAAPLFLFDASTAGSGKGLLSRVAGIISTGRQPSASQFPGREEEREKRITTFLKEGDRLIRFDNVVGTLGGQSLCTLLTEPVWKGRILAKTEGWAGAINCTTYATGNNALLGSDMDRRVVHIRIDPASITPSSARRP